MSFKNVLLKENIKCTVLSFFCFIFVTLLTRFRHPSAWPLVTLPTYQRGSSSCTQYRNNISDWIQRQQHHLLFTLKNIHRNSFNTERLVFIIIIILKFVYDSVFQCLNTESSENSEVSCISIFVRTKRFKPSDRGLSALWGPVLTSSKGHLKVKTWF